MHTHSPSAALWPAACTADTTWACAQQPNAAGAPPSAPSAPLWDRELLWDLLTAFLLLGSALCAAVLLILSFELAPPPRYDVYDAQRSAKARFLLLDRQEPPEVRPAQPLLPASAPRYKLGSSINMNRENTDPAPDSCDKRKIYHCLHAMHLDLNYNCLGFNSGYKKAMHGLVVDFFDCFSCIDAQYLVSIDVYHHDNLHLTNYCIIFFSCGRLYPPHNRWRWANCWLLLLPCSALWQELAVFGEPTEGNRWQLPANTTGLEVRHLQQPGLPVLGWCAAGLVGAAC